MNVEVCECGDALTLDASLTTVVRVQESGEPGVIISDFVES